MILSIYFIFLAFVIGYIYTVSKQTAKVKNVRPTIKKPIVHSYSKTGHEDHTRPLPHNSDASFMRNNEKDIVKDKPLTEAERNVYYGK